MTKENIGYLQLICYELADFTLHHPSLPSPLAHKKFEGSFIKNFAKEN